MAPKAKKFQENQKLLKATQALCSEIANGWSGPVSKRSVKEIVAAKLKGTWYEKK